MNRSGNCLPVSLRFLFALVSLLSCSLFYTTEGAFGQAASVTWPLDGTSQLMANPLPVASVQGANEVLGASPTMSIFNYGATGQRLYAGTTGWVTGPENPTRYVQFDASPVAGQSLSVTNVSFNYGDNSLSFDTHTLNSNVYYSTDNWTTRTLLNSSPLLYLNTTMSSFSVTIPAVTVLSGSTFSLRIFPFAIQNQNAGTPTFAIHNTVVIGGTTAVIIATGPDLGITKTAVVSGQTVTYTLTFSGTPSVLSPVTVTDQMTPWPAGSYFDSVSGVGSCATLNSTTGTLNCPVVVNGSTISPITVVVEIPAGGVITNCATINDVGDTNLANNQSCVTNTVTTPAAADLAIAKTGVINGQNVSYTITVTNIGTGTALGPITVSDALPSTPAGLTWSSASGTCSGSSTGTTTCTSPGNLAPGGTSTFTLVLNVPKGGSVTNCASVTESSNAATLPETNLANNQACTTNTVPAPGAPDLAITKVGVVSGQNVTYTITVTNVGTVAAPGPIVVTDPLPSSSTAITFLSASTGCSGSSNGTVTCTSAANLAPAGTLTYTIVVNAPNGGSFGNCATVTETGNAATLPDPNLTNNQSCTKNVVLAPAGPDLAISKTATVSGQNVTYTITVTNVGTAVSSAPIVVTDPLPSAPAGITFSSYGAGCSGSSSGPITCSSANGLAPNATLTFTIVLTLPKGGNVTNCATVAVKPTAASVAESNLSNNKACTTNTVTTQGTPDLAIVKSAVVKGSTVTYTITVTNVGTLAAAGPIQVTDPLPTTPGGITVAFLSAACSFSSSSGAVACSDPNNLAPGGTLTFTIVINVPKSGTVANCATVKTSTGETNTSNNGSCVTTKVSDSGVPDLVIRKAAKISGNTIVYTITVTNIGTVAAASPIVVTDPLPSAPGAVQFSSISGTCTGSYAGPIVCTDPTALAPGQTLAPITITVSLSKLPGYVTNCATVVQGSGTTVPAELNLLNNQACSTAFFNPKLGGATQVSKGLMTDPVQVGYARISMGMADDESPMPSSRLTSPLVAAVRHDTTNTLQPGDGVSAPSGLAIFGFRENNVLVSEAGVPASGLLQSGRIYAEVGGGVDTGLAIANPNADPATVSFFFTDSNGDFGQGSAIIPAYGQIANFLDQAPYNSPSSLNGTFTFSSSAPISVVALHGFTNERSEFLITTLPVIDLSADVTGDTLVFPHFADGGGWTTQVVLVNPTDNVLTGTLEFRAPTGLSATLNLNGQTNSAFAYSIPARSSQKLTTSGTGASTQSGSIRVVPATGTAAPSGVAVFSYVNNGITVSQSGVPIQSEGTAFRIYAETSDSSHGSIETGVAVANPLATPAVVTVELYNLDGTSTGLTGSLSIPANGQTALFLNQIPGFAALPAPFQGVMRLSSSTSIAVAGLRGRYNERGDFLFTTTPPVDENAAPPTTDLFFPHIVDSGGYTTQFILFSGYADQTSSGTLEFFTQSGDPWNLIPQ